ncbi:hypothetical protein PoB_006437800 [Plakobranchus ocellatus]|uniref:Uncharacterized protein n=1 Tax=Plakobranchus ocellatus TaxID=259542 RepID=A0AAV4D0Z8_9GAST|nr:hypothetical protein PoB_006437800 [Plakobranchus ocellatus]
MSLGIGLITAFQLVFKGVWLRLEDQVSDVHLTYTNSLPGTDVKSRPARILIAFTRLFPYLKSSNMHKFFSLVLLVVCLINLIAKQGTEAMMPNPYMSNMFGSPFGMNQGGSFLNPWGNWMWFRFFD